MRQNINQLGGNIHNENVRCRRCFVRQGGGFDPKYGILLCANHIHSRSHLEDTMAHGRYLVMLENTWSAELNVYQKWSTPTIIYVSKCNGKTICGTQLARRLERQL